MADITVGGKSQLEVTHREHFKVELARGQRGSYGWNITTYAATAEKAIKQLVEVDNQLKIAFPNGNGNGSTE